MPTTATFRGSTGRDITTRKYTGQEHDADSGLSYYQARYYDSRTGRFITPDAMVPGGIDNPKGLNRFAYVENNPIRYVDPSGHLTDETRLAALVAASYAAPIGVVQVYTTIAWMAAAASVVGKLIELDPFRRSKRPWLYCGATCPLENVSGVEFLAVVDEFATSFNRELGRDEPVYYETEQLKGSGWSRDRDRAAQRAFNEVEVQFMAMVRSDSKYAQTIVRHRKIRRSLCRIDCAQVKGRFQFPTGPLQPYP